MKNNKYLNNVDLMIDEVKEPIDKAKFIISNVYYYLRAFYSDIYSLTKKEFEYYLNSFKNKFKPKEISNSFSFNLFNKYNNNDYKLYISNPDNSQEKRTNEEIYYDLLYKQLINILIKINPSVELEEKKLINSFISLRNCFIFLEYLYLFITENSDKINHYIIKFDISILLEIPKRTSKRLINSDEFFYLNLIELKGLFKNIDYTPSNFINKLDDILYNKYDSYQSSLKSEKITILKNQLNDLMETLSKFNNNNVAILIDYIEQIYKNILKDSTNKNRNYDDLIKKYISEIKNNENKKLKQILDEINENNKVPEFNYLYLIALNNTRKIIENEDENESNDIKIIMKEKENKNKKAENDDKKNINNNKNTNNTFIMNDKSFNYKIIQDQKENIITIEELMSEINIIIEKDISVLVQEEIDEDKDDEIKYIEKNFTFDKVFDLGKDNFYNILFFLEIYKQDNENFIENIDHLLLKCKNSYISLVKNLNSINYNYFYNLIKDNHFHDEIMSILKSKPIEQYLNGYRYYDIVDENDKNQDVNKFEFVNKGENYVEYLSDEYNELMKKLKDGLFFTNLFRLKYLPLGIKAIVNYNLKIFFNPLYYEFNENIDENNKNIIFRAALKIIIVHEIIHILKYLKKDVNFNNIPETPREREGGKMFINYLFGKPVIKRINLEEAQKINDLKSWEDINALREIFDKEELQVEKDPVNNNIDHVDLYFTEEDIEEDTIEKKEINGDIGIDID